MWERFALKYVEGSTSDTFAQQCLNKRMLANNRTAGHVHYDGFRFHLRELGRAHQARTGWIQITVQAYKV